MEDCLVCVVVDNIYMGLFWQYLLKYGVDLVFYFVIKYIGGYSDVIVGVCLGSWEVMMFIKILWIFFGNMAGFWIGWLLMWSLEIFKVRMEQQCVNVQKVVDFFSYYLKVEYVNYFGLFMEVDGEVYCLY